MITVGTEVTLKRSVKKTHKCPQGRENNKTAVVAAEMNNYAPGALYLDRDLHGCKYWNVDDVEEVSNGPN